MASADSIEAEFATVRRKCIAEGKLWKDPGFPADDKILEAEAQEGVIWKRPPEICQLNGTGLEPKFILDGASRFDIVQGDLGNCWVVVACTCITQNPELFRRVVPQDQGFEPGTYCGAFRFRFWRYGEWETVIVDDRLPTKGGKLVFARSSAENEFWAALLEKAYAKLHQNYKALEDGNVADALTDFTGSLVEWHDLAGGDNPPDLPDILTKCFAMNAFAVASINRPSMPQTVLPNGLVTNHAYNITSIQRVPGNDGKEIVLLRIRNPWGSEVEWNGDWSDNSERWDTVPAELKSTIDFKSQHDGEFWMACSEFKQHFHSVEICHYTPEDVPDSPNAWSQFSVESGWVAGESAGGNDSQELFGRNPQIRLDFEEAEEEVVIEIMQKNRRECGKENLPIGFKVYTLPPDQDVPLEVEYLLSTKAVAGRFRRAGQLCAARSVFDRFKLHPAPYILVVFTDKPDQEGSVLIRIFSGKSN